MTSKPLNGLVVVDACVYLAGPFAGLVLADLGAEVIKVEPPEGDPLRRFGKRRNGIGFMFANMNRNKRLIHADLKDPEGVAGFRDLVARADVLLENWRPGVADRLGLDDRTLWSDNPRLLHCSITGFGHDGPRAKMPAFDTVLQGLSGLAWFHSHAGRPQPVRTYVIDKLTGVFAAQAVLAALLHRERTSVGDRIEVDMLATAAYFNFPDMFATRTAVDDDECIDPEDNPGANSVLPTSDGWIVVAPNRGSQVKRSCEAVGHPEWIEELSQIRDTRILNPLLMRKLGEVTAEEKTDHWLEAFTAHDVPVGPVLDLDEHLTDPQVLHQKIYSTRSDPQLGAVRSPRYPARFGRARGGISFSEAIPERSKP